MHWCVSFKLIDQCSRIWKRDSVLETIMFLQIVRETVRQKIDSPRTTPRALSCGSSAFIRQQKITQHTLSSNQNKIHQQPVFLGPLYCWFLGHFCGHSWSLLSDHSLQDILQVFPPSLLQSAPRCGEDGGADTACSGCQCSAQASPRPGHGGEPRCDALQGPWDPLPAPGWCR